MSTISTEIFALLNDFPAESSSLHQPLQADGTHKTHGWMERPGDDGSPWDEQDWYIYRTWKTHKKTQRNVG